MKYWELQGQIKTKEDFDKFMTLLREDWDSKHELVREADRATTIRKDGAWENCYLPDFLEALQAWVDDTQSLPDGFPFDKLTNMLCASVVYE